MGLGGWGGVGVLMPPWSAGAGLGYNLRSVTTAPPPPPPHRRKRCASTPAPSPAPQAMSSDELHSAPMLEHDRLEAADENTR
jgi:hypothetical protein